MAGRDPTRPQLEFPELVAELITLLRLSGQVGRLNFSDEVIPAFLIGSRGINFAGDAPAFTSAAVFSDTALNPAANSLVVETGALPAGTYDMIAHMHVAGTVVGATQPATVEHRDAANVATLAHLIRVRVSAVDHTAETELPLIGYVIGLNERIRCISPSGALTGVISATIFMQLRPTP